MKVLYSQLNATIKPYPRNDDNPILGLDPDYLVLDKIESPQPEYDPSTQTIREEWVIAFETLEYRQEWIIEPIVVAPVEDWPSFNTYMLTSPLFRARRDIVRPIDPELNSALYDAYALVERNGVEAFALIWAYWCQLSGIPPEEKEVLAQVAESLNLPSDFVALLRG